MGVVYMCRSEWVKVDVGVCIGYRVWAQCYVDEFMSSERVDVHHCCRVY